MKVLVQILATLFVLGVAVAGVVEILGFRIGPLDGPRWINVWQYGLGIMAGCLIIAFDTDDLIESVRLSIRLMSFPLLFWIAALIFPGLSVIWQMDWVVLAQFFASLGLVVVWLYVIYLDVRYLMLQAPPGYFTGDHKTSDPIQPGDE